MLEITNSFFSSLFSLDCFFIVFEEEQKKDRYSIPIFTSRSKVRFWNIELSSKYFQLACLKKLASRCISNGIYQYDQLQLDYKAEIEVES